jgi:hypothetical protein
MEVCFLCGAKHPSHPGDYHFTFIKKYQFSICPGCYVANWDGYSPSYDHQIIAHLKALGIPEPARNDKDLFPRE